MVHLIEYGIPSLFFTMDALAASLTLPTWSIGSEPLTEEDVDDVDDEDVAEALKGTKRVIASTYMLSILLNLALTTHLTLFETGLSDVRSLLAGVVPPYQRVAGAGLALSGVITLYSYAAAGRNYSGGDEDEGLREALQQLFFLGTFVTMLALGLGAPLSKVVNGGGGGGGGREGDGSGTSTCRCGCSWDFRCCRWQGAAH